MKRLGTILALLAALPCFGQSWYQNNAYTTTYINGTRVVQVIPGVTVKICSNVSGACVQQAVYYDQALTLQITQPMSVDGQGNFGFWLHDGTYSYRVLNAQGVQIQAYPFTVGASGGVPLTTLQTNGVNNFSQSLLDLDNGSGVTVVNTSGGHVSFSVNPSTLNPPQYQTAAANDTSASTTTSVTLPSVNKGSRLVAFADSNTYGCLSNAGQPYYPVITDSQGNAWTVEASQFSSYIGGNSGANMIVADTVLSADGSITVTATQPAAGGSCAHAYLTVAEYANVVGVDVAGVQACSLGCSGNLAPSATAVAQNNEVAVLFSETNGPFNAAIATPGTREFSDAAHTWAYIWQFGAANVGQASTSVITGNYTQNFPGAAIILLKSSLTFQTGSTINPGANYALATYGAVTSNYLYPSTILSDTSADLRIPGATALAIGTVASNATIIPTKQIFHITGTADIDRMVPPGSDGFGNGFCDQAGYGCTVTIFADSGFNFVHYTPNLSYSFVTSGVATAGEMLTFVFDHTTQLWYPITPLARGTATLAAGTVTVTTPAACAVAASCVYKLSNCGPNASTAIGTPSLGTVTAGTSFVINSLSATNTVVAGDASKVCWQIN